MAAAVRGKVADERTNPCGLRKAKMKRTPHHILVCTSVHLRGSNGTSPSSESEHGASGTGPAGPSLALLSNTELPHEPSPDWHAAWPNPLDEDALDELAEVLRPPRHTAA